MISGGDYTLKFVTVLFSPKYVEKLLPFEAVFSLAGSSLPSVRGNVRIWTGCYHRCPYLPLAGAQVQRKQPAQAASQSFMAALQEHANAIR